MIYIDYMALQLKQKYLNKNSPTPVDFQLERTRQFERLVILISTTQRKKWLSTGFNCGTLIESYKQVYGFTSQQFQTLLMILINIAFKEQGLSTDIRAYILKLLNTLTQYQIKITDNFKISNQKLMKYLQILARQGMDGTLKNSDAVIEQLSKFILFFSRFGEQIVEEALQMAIDCNDIRYLVIFLRSIKSQESALRLLAELFSDNNLWDRDCSWFYILGELVKKFPKIDYSAYYQTIMHEVIKAFTIIINGDNEDSLKKLTTSDNYLQIQPVLKSVAMTLAYLILPSSQPQHYFIKSCIQRVFVLIISSLDYVNPPDYLNDLITFSKAFVRSYLIRFRGERGQYLLFNEDSVEDYHQPNDKNLLLDEQAQQFFDSLWVDIIPRIVYLQDPEQCKPSKIIAELCMYKPQKFLNLSLNSILAVVSREDPTLVSFHGAKISILFLQQFIILDQPQHLPIYIECCAKMISHIQKLGIPQNLDLLQLFFRSFLYLSEEQLKEYYVQTLVEETLTQILQFLEPISIGLEDTNEQQAQLYIDLGNIFFPFFLRLDQNQINKFSDKFVYKLTSQVPERKEAYQMITIVLAFIDKNFPDKLVKHIMKELLTFQSEKEIQKEKMEQNGQNGEKQEDEWQFLDRVEGKLHVQNQQVLKWHTGLLQCIFQYHPENIIKHWKNIETIIVLLLKEWDQQLYMQTALDIIYNIILCLCKPHLSWKQFSAKKNGDYKTLDLKWQEMTPQTKQLVDRIFEKFYAQIRSYLQSIYGEELKKNESESAILGDFETYFEQTQQHDIIRIRKRNLKLVDYVANPGLTNPEDADQKKIIYRALSIQYTVLSALMCRVPFHAKQNNIANFFTEQKYLNLRPQTCKYLQWVLQLLGHFNMMGDELVVKVFNFFWRESHDQVSFTAAIQATNDKISPYFYPQLHRKKQLLRSPFLIVNQAYLTHMVRLELQLIAQPTAHLNNPRYLQSNFILGLNPHYEPNLHSYFPCYVQVHQYHRQLIAICRYHLNPNNPQSYMAKFLAEQDPSTKERYSTAIRSLISSFKRLLNVFSDECCMKDQFVRNTIFETISLYKILPKKNEKSLIYQLIYIMLVFSFDPLCLEDAPEYSLGKYWSLRQENNPQANEYQLATVRQTVKIQKIIEGIQNEQQNILNQFDLNRGLKLTRSCSFQNDSDIQKQLQRAINYLLAKIEENYNNLQKDFGIYLLMALLYSNSLSLKHPLISKMILLLNKLIQSNTTEIFDMSKMGFFHMINRFNYNQRIEKKIDNVPVKRSWDQFLRYKYIGGQNVNYQNIKCQKNQENFYPSKYLIQYQYKKLASDPSSPTYENQKTLLAVLEDEQGIFKFLKNCALDPDLKQEGAPESIVLSEEDFKSIATGAHKLMHFIWDSNPTKTPLFMGILQRYGASPLNFYNRLFRKIFRMGSDKIKQNCANITKTLRQCQEQQNIRLSFYISCQLMLRDPGSPINKDFIDYLGECTKENFDFALMGFYGIFTSNFITAEKNYGLLLQKLRSLKGAPRLRHLQLSNTYMIAQGRFARKAAMQMSALILKGIEQGGDEISEAIVSMITQCFVQSVNLKTLDQWVQQPLDQLIKSQKIYILNQYVAYNDQNFLLVLLRQLMRRARQEQETIESQKLRIHTQIVRKILASITIFRFNQYFYKLLKEILIYVLEKTQSNDGDTADLFVIAQLCDSEYPEAIYKNLLETLLPMTDRTPYVVKKKLMFLQGMVIHRSYRLNQIQIPPLLALNQKQLTLDYIITVATMYRLMKNSELTEQAQNALKNMHHKKKHYTYTLLAILMATGIREFDWKEKILRELTKHKKDKLVKEAISEWWKGKSPETEQEQRLAALVKNFENPYSYFA